MNAPRGIIYMERLYNRTRELQKECPHRCCGDAAYKPVGAMVARRYISALQLFHIEGVAHVAFSSGRQGNAGIQKE
jgi:hypothetical protein